MKPNVSLTSWFRHLIRDAAAGKVSVPCNGCTACCRSPNMPPRLTEEERGNYPDAEMNELLGDWSLPRKADGSCVKLIDGKCSIYESRPYICRVFDCRIYLAAACAPDDDDILLEAIEDWEPFKLPTRDDRITATAIRLAVVDGGKPKDIQEVLMRSAKWKNYVDLAKEFLDHAEEVKEELSKWPE